LTNYPGNIIPKSALSPFGQNLLNFFYPLPNYGPPGAIVNNYLATYATPISSAQGDVRTDQVIRPKHTVYARYSYKNRRVTNYPLDLNRNPGSPLPEEDFTPQIYNSLTVGYNWVVTPSVVNELRSGFSRYHVGASSSLTTQQAANELGLTSGSGGLPGPLPGGYVQPTIVLQDFLVLARPIPPTRIPSRVRNRSWIRSPVNSDVMCPQSSIYPRSSAISRLAPRTGRQPARSR
jgi:hypothetical protein